MGSVFAGKSERVLAGDLAAQCRLPDVLLFDWSKNRMQRRKSQLCNCGVTSLERCRPRDRQPTTGGVRTSDSRSASCKAGRLMQCDTPSQRRFECNIAGVRRSPRIQLLLACGKHYQRKVKYSVVAEVGPYNGDADTEQAIHCTQRLGRYCVFSPCSVTILHRS